jgi:hypothetical protein
MAARDAVDFATHIAGLLGSYLPTVPGEYRVFASKTTIGCMELHKLWNVLNYPN